MTIKISKAALYNTIKELIPQARIAKKCKTFDNFLYCCEDWNSNPWDNGKFCIIYASIFKQAECRIDSIRQILNQLQTFISMCLQNQLTGRFYNLSHLAIIEVSGDDASQFLQGQLTCNINDISEVKASIAAFCNAKGRVISTLIVAKAQQSFLLILPESLAETVRKRLQLYVLRSKVKLTISANLSLYGVFGTYLEQKIALPEESFGCSRSQNLTCIKMPSEKPRFIVVAYSTANEISLFDGVQNGALSEWRYQDISTGFPWLAASQTEAYIPQMLNIDQLGGISFNKGCYTGQEIVARTHYLGKSKRQLYVAECDVNFPPDAEISVLSAENQTKCGEIVALQALGQNTRLLIVLQTVDDSLKNLILSNLEHTPITLIAYQ